MKIRLITVFVSVLLLCGQISAERLGNISEVLKPDSIRVSGDELYVAQGAKVFVYSLKDFRLIRQFGKAGEGPGELKESFFWASAVTVTGDTLFVQGLDKFIYFSKEGKVRKERRKNMRYIKVQPVGKNFLARIFMFQEKNGIRYTSLNILGPDLKKIKEIYREPLHMVNEPGKTPMPPDTANFCVWGDKIFLEKNTGEFVIEIFDSSGNRLYEIKKEAAKIPFTANDKKMAMDYIKESFSRKRLTFFVPVQVGQGGWEAFKKWCKPLYPEYYPPIRDILVNNGKIYTRTYKRKGNKDQYIIMDLKGKTLKETFLPEIKDFNYDFRMMGMNIRMYDIDNGRLIYLLENEDTEEWDVHMIKI